MVFDATVSDGDGGGDFIPLPGDKSMSITAGDVLSSVTAVHAVATALTSLISLPTAAAAHSVVAAIVVEMGDPLTLRVTSISGAGVGGSPKLAHESAVDGRKGQKRFCQGCVQ